MNKEQFMLRLSGGLSALPPEMRKELLADYEDHFRSGLEHGKSEEEIAFELGSPEELAQEALALRPAAASYPGPEAASHVGGTRAETKRKSSFSPVRLIMLLFWSLLAIPAWLVAWSFAVALGAFVLASLASPLLFAADLLINRTGNTAEFFAVLLLLGIGMLTVGPFLKLIRLLAAAARRYAVWNVTFIMGRN
ncbi:DUF1700 domain-containing protein [Saccharibacillus alkalitolerans]|uniref:DUF1700 domain-containing protein n=1 Tax=Saccharibacillus alkalitolerans TaxID=2705290 RepID=A0ABX0F3J4_9BACL|nr:DUF1700 domain-containing protein [Saccharibacillus alkalitolerans]NGZ75531.1 DUF1700 domain-containing protein [Saccharibacillus alkalitolerans]